MGASSNLELTQFECASNNMGQVGYVIYHLAIVITK
jgi:hypothetical protein